MLNYEVNCTSSAPTRLSDSYSPSSRNSTRGDKVGACLARRLQAQTTRANIAKLKHPDGTWAISEADKSLELENFYRDLYANAPCAHDAVSAFLYFCPWDPIDPYFTKLLDDPITHDEIAKALKQLPIGKTPGPDGLPVTFYRVFYPQLRDHMLHLFNSFTDDSGLTPTMNEAEVVLIPKPGKDHTLPASFRPIALLNTDAKIYMKILANRLEPHLPGLIDPDQVGFIRRGIRQHPPDSPPCGKSTIQKYSCLSGVPRRGKGI